MRQILLIITTAVFCFAGVRVSHAQSPDTAKTTYYKGTIVERLDQKLKVAIQMPESAEPKVVEVPDFSRLMAGSGGLQLDPGAQVIVTSNIVNGAPTYAILDNVRTVPYAILAAIFVALVVVVGRIKGFFAIFAMIASFAVIVNITVPQIMSGVNPIFVSLITALIIVPLTFYLSHGFQLKTTLSVLSTMIALLLTGILAFAFTYLVNLSGLSGDESAYLAIQSGNTLAMRDLLIAGMIIAGMGVLDDVTISQVNIVKTLYEVNPDLSRKRVFEEAMKAGRDHIASLVNTLVLVYAGAAMPIFLLVYQSNAPLWVVLQREAIAQEYVKTLVSSIGIIAAVPIATGIAIRFVGHFREGLQKERLF